MKLLAVRWTLLCLSLGLALLGGSAGCTHGPSVEPAPSAASVAPSTAGVATPAKSSAAAPPRASLDGTQSYTIASENVDQTFLIDVWAPYGTTTPLPVVYVLDGNILFATTAQAALQAVYAQELPPVIIVGIGYKTDNPADAGVLRLRDLTPTRAPTYEKRASAGLPIPDGLQSGGADAFLRFINEELKPFIAARHDVDPKQATLFGHSLGGLFAMHVALASPDSFSRYLVGSPYLAWDDELLFSREAAHRPGAEAWPVRIFLSAGGLETGIRDTYHKMSARLRQRTNPGFELRTLEFPGETHTSAIGPTVGRGLRELF